MLHTQITKILCLCCLLVCVQSGGIFAAEIDERKIVYGNIDWAAIDNSGMTLSVKEETFHLDSATQVTYCEAKSSLKVIQAEAMDLHGLGVVLFPESSGKIVAVEIICQ